MFYLLDTNTASFVIKGNVPRVRQRLIRIPASQVAISAVTAADLLFGVARRPEATRLKAIVEEFLARVEVLPWEREAAAAYADLRAALERAGITISNLDMMIAAHAVATGSVLVSSDRAFARIRQLKVEDWTKV